MHCCVRMGLILPDSSSEGVLSNIPGRSSGSVRMNAVQMTGEAAPSGSGYFTRLVS